jgi:Integron Cassette Protein Hfx_Cass5
MKADDIALIEIDDSGRLCVSPKSASYPFIYRAGMEVHWDPQSKYLFSPPPIEWSYTRWLRQIREAVKGEYGVTLAITPQTQWRNIDEALKSELAAVMDRSASA